MIADVLYGMSLVKLDFVGLIGAHDLGLLMPHISNRQLKVRKTVFG